MKVRFTRPASVDLDEILSYVREHSLQGAGRVQASIEAATKLLEQFPLTGTRTRLPWLRRLNVSSYPYLILYEVTGRDIDIHAVRHSARNPSTMPARR